MHLNLELAFAIEIATYCLRTTIQTVRQELKETGQLHARMDSSQNCHF